MWKRAVNQIENLDYDLIYSGVRALFDAYTTINPDELKPMLGVRAVKPMDDWNNGKMESLRLPQEGKVFQYTKIQMTRNENGLIDEFAI